MQQNILLNCHTVATIQKAAFHADIDALKIIRNSGTEINICDDRGISTLQMALYGALYLSHGNKTIKQKLTDTIHMLLNSGANVNIMDEGGDSLLHVAVKAYSNNRLSKQCIHLLLEYGARTNVQDSNGKTSYEEAFLNGHVKLGEIILLYSNKFNTPGAVGCLINKINGIMFQATWEEPSGITTCRNRAEYHHKEHDLNYGVGNTLNINDTPEDINYACPICFERFAYNVHIYQCYNGHIYCQSCKEKPEMKRCPFCRIDISNVNIRNLALEEIVDSGY